MGDFWARNGSKNKEILDNLISNEGDYT